jgi:hypothetical protein
MQTDFLQYIFQAINNLLTQNLGFFDAMGQNLFRSFATILVAWFGIKSALASASGRAWLPVRSFCQPASDHQLWLRDGQLLQHADPRRRTASTISSPTKRSFSRARSIRPSCKRWSRRLLTSNPAWTRPAGEISSERHLRTESPSCSPPPRPSRSWSSPMGSSPLPFACWWDRSSYRFLSFRRWNGSSGAGSAASSNMPSTRSSPQPLCMSSEISCSAL